MVADIDLIHKSTAVTGRKGKIMNKKGITYIEVLRRTFEGKTDPSKNDDALTSKYYPSKKYLLRYKFVGYGFFVNETHETKAVAEFAKEQLLKYNFDCRGLQSFDYNGHTFHFLRNLTTTELAEENINRRSGNIIEIKGYSHKDFYEKAGEKATDLFVMDGKAIVIPRGKGIAVYDENIRLETHDLTYYTACCGKIVDKHSEDKKSGLTVKGKFPATGDTYCNRCKRDVTRTGDVKKTPRNADIDENGSWDYKLVSSGGQENE